MGLAPFYVHDVPWVSFKDRVENEKCGCVLKDSESEPSLKNLCVF